MHQTGNNRTRLTVTGLNRHSGPVNGGLCLLFHLVAFRGESTKNRAIMYSSLLSIASWLTYLVALGDGWKSYYLITIFVFALSVIPIGLCLSLASKGYKNGFMIIQDIKISTEPEEFVKVIICNIADSYVFGLSCSKVLIEVNSDNNSDLVTATMELVK